jgi:hypothetical protein
MLCYLISSLTAKKELEEKIEMAYVSWDLTDEELEEEEEDNEHV